MGAKTDFWRPSLVVSRCRNRGSSFQLKDTVDGERLEALFDSAKTYGYETRPIHGSRLTPISGTVRPHDQYVRGDDLSPVGLGV